MPEQTRRATLPIVAVVVVSGLIVLLLWWWWCPTATVIVLRHAEKDLASTETDDRVPLLVPYGTDRAAMLAQVLARAGVTRIYVTEKLRTRETAKPLATARGITPIPINAADIDQLVSEVQSSANRGRVIVVVGHSDTVPTIVDRLGGGAVTVAESQFDNLFILTLRRWRPTRIIQATYGAPR